MQKVKNTNCFSFFLPLVTAYYSVPEVQGSLQNLTSTCIIAAMEQVFTKGVSFVASLKVETYSRY